MNETRSPTPTRARSPRACAACLAIACASLAPAARAQPVPAEQASVAQALWEQALAAMEKKDYAAACPKIEEVVRLRPDGLGAKLKLAECYEGAGRLASAWAMYALAESLASKAGDARVARAHEHGTALEPRLAKLTIVVADAVRALPDVEIKRDDTVVGPAQWGVPLPVDRGHHVVVVRAPGKERWERTADVAADGDMASITIDGLSDAKAPEIKPPEDRRRSLAPGLALAGVAVAGVGAGVAFLVVSSAKKSDAENTRTTILAARQSCVPGAANFAGQASCNSLASGFKADDAFHDAAVGALVVGAAAAVGTAAYFLWPAKRPAPAAQGGLRDLRVNPVIAGPGDGGLVVSGTF
jgi:hypothetical protein